MKVVIEEYQSSWPNLFLKEQGTIAKTLQSLNPSIEHIGSTAVPGLAAKPIIDILVGLNNSEDLNKTILPLQNEGYTYVKKYEPQWPTRRFFIRLNSSTLTIPSIVDTQDSYIIGKDFISSVHVHIIVKNTEDWHRHLAFRDFLRAHSSISENYGKLKKQLSALEFTDMNEYNEAKNNFVKQTEQIALEWYWQNKTKNNRPSFLAAKRLSTN